MTTDNIQLSHITKGKEAIIFIDKYTTAELSEIRKMCRENDLNVSCIIYNYTLHDDKPYKEIIKYITDQDKPPVVIIDSNTCLFPQCIMSSTVLGTLEEMQLARIHTYNHHSKQNKLELIKQSTFDLLTEATWQLRSIEEMCMEKEQKARKKGK